MKLPSKLVNQMNPSRRLFLTGLVAAPAVLRLGLWMPVRKWIEETPIPRMHTTLIDPEIAKLMSTSMQIMNAEGEIQHIIISALGNEIYIGDKVILSCQKSNIHQAVFLAFVLPFILILITLIILLRVISNEVILGFISLSVLLPYYVILSFFKVKLRSKFKFDIRKDLTV